MQRGSLGAGAVVLAVALAGCGGSSGGGKRGGAKVPPTVAITTPAGTQSGDVTIAYSAIDVQSDLLALTVEYSTDGGQSFLAATDAGPGAGSDGTAGIPSSPNTGTPHVFVWDSLADIVGLVLPDVRVRITPRDGGPGIADTSGAFGLDNNRISTAVVATPPGGTGDIAVDYELIDPDGQLLTIQVEYSEDAGITWAAATDAGPGAGSEGTTALASAAAPGVSHVFVWDSAADLA